MTQPSDTKIKICGLKTPEAMTVALEEGADFVGLVFCENSPRYVEIEVASYLANFVPDRTAVVGLFVNPTERQLEETLYGVRRLDYLQLHGRETPEEVYALKQKTGKKIMKALSIRSADDLTYAQEFAEICDWLLYDAPPLDDKGPAGGTGKSFDWELLNDHKAGQKWMLAGGLTHDNVADAIKRLSPTAVDVSSGVESSRGVKDPDKIRAFIRTVRGL